MAKLFVAFFCLCLSLPVVAEQFPRPASLQPNINFWERVYTEIDRTQGFLHDPDDLSIVYETMNVPANAGRQARKRLVKKAKYRLRKQLERIAGKQLSALKGEQLRLRKLFPDNASAASIHKAARRIRFQLGQADKFRAALSRSGQYMPYIRQEMLSAGLPDQLSVLPFVESSFNIVARSHVGAAGIWQFMPATGRRFMKVNHVIDERYDPYRATRAAVKLLKYNYDILQSWPLALTAYNHGVGGMRRAIRKTGTKDIGVIAKRYKSRSFGFASRNFYAEFIAALDVASQPEKYFKGIRPQSPKDYYYFKLDQYVPADSLADALNVSIDQLRKHNLALREPIWQGEKRIPANYQLRIPRNLLANTPVKLVASIPAAEQFSDQVPDKTYRVQRGDSLSRIAGLFKVKVSDLVAMNNLRSRHRIRAGQIIYLPQPGDKGQRVAAVAPSVSSAPTSPPATKPAQPPVAKPSKPTVVAAAEPETPAEPETIPAPQASESGDQAEADSISMGASLSEEIAAVDPDSQQLAATDPADYSIAKDGTIEIQAAETLGHYADWLGLPTRWLRKLNGYSFRKQLVIGHRLKLDFSKLSRGEFSARRASYHKSLEDEFFATRQITSTQDYHIRRGDSLWHISQQRPEVPLWLIRQYNPDVDFGALKPGQIMVLPVIGSKAASN